MPIHRLRFLIVDPSATTRRILRNLLREIGPVQIDEAADSRSALAWLASTPCDFLIAETQIPIIDGFELVATVRRDPSRQTLPALLVTREANKDQVVRAARVGASGYIVRPLTRSALEDKILSILGLPARPATRRHEVAQRIAR